MLAIGRKGYMQIFLKFFEKVLYYVYNDFNTKKLC